MLSKQLLELAAEIQHVRRAYQEGMAGAMPGNAHQTAATERDKERDERATLADGYRAASDGKPFKANPIPTTSVALYTK